MGCGAMVSYFVEGLIRPCLSAMINSIDGGPMKKGILAILLVLLLSGCNFPLTTAPANTPTATVGISSEIPFQTETLQPVETTPPAAQATATLGSESKTYSQNGISFDLPTCLASDAAISTVPAVPVDPNGMA